MQILSMPTQDVGAVHDADAALRLYSKGALIAGRVRGRFLDAERTKQGERHGYTDQPWRR